MRTRVTLSLAVLAATAACTATDLDRLSAHYGPTAGGAGGDVGAGGTTGTGGEGKGGGGSSGAAGGGKAGSAGAGTGGGSSVCDVPMTSCSGCQLCVTAPGGPCVAEATACMKNAECGALQDCQNKCMDASCATKCDEQHPTGVTPFLAFNMCRATSCKQACTTKLVCTGIPKNVTGACFAAQPCNAVTNKGCNAAAGEACDFDGMTSAFKCFGPPPANNVPLCGSCDVSACMPGLACFATTAAAVGADFKCTPFCCVDADCGPPGQGKCGGMTPGLPGGVCMAQ